MNFLEKSSFFENFARDSETHGYAHKIMGNRQTDVKMSQKDVKTYVGHL